MIRQFEIFSATTEASAQGISQRLLKLQCEDFRNSTFSATAEALVQGISEGLCLLERKS